MWKEFVQETQETLDQPIHSSSDAVLFAIDMSNLMHDLLSTILTSLQSLLTARINDADLIGIILVNSSKKQNPMDLDGLYLLYDLDISSVERIKALESLTPEILIKKFGGGESNVSDIFWCANNLFASRIKSKVVQKHLILVTAPPTSDLNAANVRARDLVDVGCLISIFTFSPTDAFKGMVEQIDAPIQPITHVQVTREDFLSKLTRKSSKKTRLFTLPFTLYPGVVLGVVGYSLIVPQKAPSSVLLDACTNTLVERKTLNICNTTAQILEESDIKYAFEYAGQLIPFTKQEIEAIKFKSEPGLTLLGFKDKSILKFNYNTTHSCLVYPSDSNITGSSSVFANLVDSMTRLDRVAVCALVSRRNSYSRLVALYASKDELYGLVCVYLPFADDKRKVAPFKEIPSVDEELIEATKQIVKKLVLKDFNPAKIPNPALELFEEGVAALALGRDFNPSKDATLPRVSGMHKRCRLDLVSVLLPQQEPIVKKRRRD